MIRKHIKRSVRVSRYVIYRETLVNHKEHFWAFVGSFIGIGIIAYIQSHILTENDNLFLIGSFGASAVMVFGVIQSPLAQPRNLIGGHLISALAGVTIYQFLPDIVWIAACCCAVNCIDASHEDTSSSWWSNSIDCSYWFRESESVGVLVCVVAGIGWLCYSFSDCVDL